jgi:hypothetical protein
MASLEDDMAAGEAVVLARVVAAEVDAAALGPLERTRGDEP